MWYKLCKFYENRAMDKPLWGIYIPHFDQISVKISVLGVLYPNRCTDGGEIWQGGGDLRSPPPCQISPHRCNVSPLQGEKTSKSASEKIKYRRLSHRVMLPVTTGSLLPVTVYTCCRGYGLKLSSNVRHIS